MAGVLLRSCDVRALLQALDALYQPVAVARFPAHLFALLSELLPGTAVSLDFVDAAGRNAESHVSPNHLTPGMAARVEAVVREFIWQNPVITQIVSGNPGVIQPTDLISQREFRRTDLYQLAFRPSEVEYQLVAPLAWPNRQGGLVINRHRARNFTTREVEIVTQLRPHVERAYLAGWRLADLRRRLLEAQAAVAAAGHAVHPAIVLGVTELTRREAEVFHWVSQGKRNGEIAIILGISARTVEKHVEHLFAKLGVETRTAIAAVANGPRRSPASPPPLH